MNQVHTNLYRCLLLWYNWPAITPPVEPEKVVYTDDVNSKATDKITEDYSLVLY